MKVLPSERNAVDLVARTIFNDARNESREAMDAIASTIMNRFNLNREEFGGRNFFEVLDIGFAGVKGETPLPRNNIEVLDYDYIKMISEQVVMGSFTDTVNGATHYDRNKESY